MKPANERLKIDVIYAERGFDANALGTLEISVPDSVEEWKLAVIHIDATLNDVEAFAPPAIKMAEKYNAIILMLTGNFYDDKKQLRSMKRIGSLADFKAMPATVKFFVEGVEDQLSRKVLYLGYPGGKTMQWHNVPLHVNDRWASVEDNIDTMHKAWLNAYDEAVQRGEKVRTELLEADHAKRFGKLPDDCERCASAAPQ